MKQCAVFPISSCQPHRKAEGIQLKPQHHLERQHPFPITQPPSRPLTACRVTQPWGKSDYGFCVPGLLHCACLYVRPLKGPHGTVQRNINRSMRADPPLHFYVQRCLYCLCPQVKKKQIQTL